MLSPLDRAAALHYPAAVSGARGPGGWCAHMIFPWQDRNRRFSPLKAVTLALMFVPGIWMIRDYVAEEFGFDPFGGLTYWSGYWATVVLLLSLAVTPAGTLFGWRRLIIVRRMIGVTALVYTVAHILIYFALRRWNFDRIGVEMVTRLTLIVATLSTVGLVALGATSLDAAIRAVGAPRWQRLHDTVYVVTGLAIAHYLLARGLYPDEFLMTGVFFWLMLWRALNRRGLGAHVGALTALAVASGVFTAVLEIGWIWYFRGYKLAEIFNIYFTTALGIPPASKVLALGLLAAAGAAVRQIGQRKSAERKPDMAMQATFTGSVVET